MIIETSANKFYEVVETDNINLSHLWWGLPVKKVKGGFIAKKHAKQQLVRKQGCKIVTSISLPVLTIMAR